MSYYDKIDKLIEEAEHNNNPKYSKKIASGTGRAAEEVREARKHKADELIKQRRRRDHFRDQVNSDVIYLSNLNDSLNELKQRAINPDGTVPESSARVINATEDNVKNRKEKIVDNIRTGDKLQSQVFLDAARLNYPGYDKSKDIWYGQGNSSSGNILTDLRFAKRNMEAIDDDIYTNRLSNNKKQQFKIPTMRPDAYAGVESIGNGTMSPIKKTLAGGLLGLGGLAGLYSLINKD